MEFAHQFILASDMQQCTGRERKEPFNSDVYCEKEETILTAK